MSVAKLVAENFEWIRKAAVYYFRNGMDADDLAAETACRCLRNADRFKGSDSRFRGWVRAVMVNIYRDWYNRRRTVLFTDYGLAADCIGEGSADDHANLSDLLDMMERCRRLTVSMEALDLFRQGYTQPEISALLDIPAGTVRSRICIGRKILREMMDA